MGGREAKSYDRKNAWFPINHSIISVSGYQRGDAKPYIIVLLLLGELELIETTTSGSEPASDPHWIWSVDPDPDWNPDLDLDQGASQDSPLKRKN